MAKDNIEQPIRVPPPLEDLLPADADRLSDLVIAHMEQTMPEIWLIYLYEFGLEMVLSQFLGSSPFEQISPATAAMEREIGKLTSLSRWHGTQVFKAMDQKIKQRELVAKYLSFKPPRQK